MVALLAATAPTLGWAQSSEVEEVVVTGSFIAGTAKDTALPVDVIDQVAIEKRGSPSVLDMIRTLPSAGAIIGEANTINAAGQGLGGSSTANLRGLGPNRTLVLLNGRRLAGFGGATVDTNLMPLAAVARVEVLKDGAAATYGSDAIAGVVNFITRKDLDGFAVSGDYSLIQGSTGDYNLGAAYGWSNDRLNVLLSAGYQKRSHISTRERDWALVPWVDNPQGGFSGNANPGSFRRVAANGVSLAGPFNDPQCAVLGNVPTSASSCLYSYQPFQNLVEGQNRYQMFGSVEYEITDNIKFHGEALVAHTKVVSQQAPAYTPLQYPTGAVLNAGAPAVPNRYVIPCNSPGLQDMFTQNPGFAALVGGAGCVNSPGAPANSYVAVAGWRAMGVGGNLISGFSKYNDRKIDAMRVSGGFSGEFGDGIGWDVAATYMTNEVTYFATDQLVNRLQLALAGFGGPACTGTTPGANGCLWFNPFSNSVPRNVATGAVNPQYNPAVANSSELARWMEVPVDSYSLNTLMVYDAVLNGKLNILELPGGQIGWAVGAQYRKTTLETEYGAFNDLTRTPCIDSLQNPAAACSPPQGMLNFSTSSTPVDLEQSVKAVFAEFNLPITDTLNAQFAIRYEDYGGGVGATTNPKLAAKWQITPALALRGSIGTTFRGPTASNVDTGKTTGLSPVTAAGGTSKAIDFFGNPGLKPETATSGNIGILFDTGGLRAAVDYWRFDFKDSIVSPAYDIIATSVVPTANGPANCAAPLRNLITFDNGDTCIAGLTTGANILRVRADLINGPPTTTSGLDFDLAYRIDDVMGGDLTFSGSATYILEYEVGATTLAGVPLAAGYSAVGYLNDDRGGNSMPRYKAYGRVDYAYGIHNLGLGVRYVASYVDNRRAIFNPASLKGWKIPDTFQVDLNYLMRMEKATFSFSIENLFDTDPAFARTAYSYDTFVGNPYGRVLKFGVKASF